MHMQNNVFISLIDVIFTRVNSKRLKENRKKDELSTICQQKISKKGMSRKK